MSTFFLFQFKHRVLVPGVVYAWLLMSTYRDLDIELSVPWRRISHHVKCARLGLLFDKAKS